MNYIAEIRAFYGWLGANPLKSPAIALWHALMSIANEASNDADWLTQITPAIPMLQSRSGLSKDAIITARQQLKQRGRIDWKSRAGNQSAIYTIIPFVSFKPTQSTAQSTAQTPAQTPAQSPPIYRLNQTRQNNTTTTAREAHGLGEVMSAFMDKISPCPSERSVDELKGYLTAMDADCCLRAIDEAVDAGARNWNYVRKILSVKQSQGVRTLADWEMVEKDRERSKHGAIASGASAGNRNLAEKDWGLKDALTDGV